MRLKKILKACAYARETGDLVHVYPLNGSGIRFAGYIVGSSDEFAVLNYVDTGSVTFNGYIAFPIRGIKHVEKFDAGKSFVHRALQFKGLFASRPLNIQIDSFAELLASIDAHFPLMAIYTGQRASDGCSIGRVAKLTGKSVSLRQIDRAAKWIRVKKFKFRDIARVDFADGYEDALWRVSENEKSRSEKAQGME